MQANAYMDRASIGREPWIGADTKIDDVVQVGHQLPGSGAHDVCSQNGPGRISRT